MSQWRINLDGLAESDRLALLSRFLARFEESLDRLFPTELGYRSEGFWHTGVPNLLSFPQTALWQISRGRFWGLRVTVVAKDQHFTKLTLSLDGYFPLVDRAVGWVERFEGNLGGDLLTHFIFPLLIIPAIALFPLLLALRIAKLAIRSDVTLATRALETIWEETRGHSPLTPRIARVAPRPLICLLGFFGGCGVSGLCFWLAGLAAGVEVLQIALYIAGLVLAIPTIGLLIAFIMTLLGFEVEI